MDIFSFRNYFECYLPPTGIECKEPSVHVRSYRPEIVQSPVIRKLEVSPELRYSFLERLFREKNVNKTSLFPGRDFCETLRLELRAMVERAKAEYEEELRSVQMGEVVPG
jgi:hypothetical protein